MAPFRTKYPSFRPVRGDGNCFYTGFAIALLEHAVKTKQIHSLLTRIVCNFQWNSPGTENFVELLLELFSNPDVLEERLQTNRYILCADNLLRHIAASEMRTHPDQYRPFLEKKLEAYIEENVLPMGEDADHFAIHALCRALEFSILIHDVGVDTHLDGTQMGDAAMAPAATLCRDGEHYFFFYSEAIPTALHPSLSPIIEAVDHASVPSPSSSSSAPSRSSASKSIRSKSSAPAPTTRAAFSIKPAPGYTYEIWGDGPGMESWKKGVPLRKSKENTWVWESKAAFEPFDYKIVRKKKDGSLQWEVGKNHKMTAGKSETVTPKF